MTQYHAQAKFLITAEYLVLQGAEALALPLNRKNQDLLVMPCEKKHLRWRAFDENNLLWFEALLDLDQLSVLETTNVIKAGKLQSIFQFLKQQVPHLFLTGLQFETRMNFSPEWGLGSSSTFVSLLAQWSKTSAFELQKLFFAGSGYDIACAQSSAPLLFQLKNQIPVVTPVEWSPSFKNHLYFLYLGKKMDSRQSVKNFIKKNKSPDDAVLQKMNTLTRDFLKANDLKTFQRLMQEHETMLAPLLGIEPVQTRLFPGFEGAIKSLGAWGGDFVMVASKNDPRSYFKKQGLSLIFTWDDLIQ